MTRPLSLVEAVLEKGHGQPTSPPAPEPGTRCCVCHQPLGVTWCVLPRGPAHAKCAGVL